MTTLAIIILIISLINLVFVLVEFVFLKGVEFILEAIKRKREKKSK